jgi:hypothetical protein
VKRLDLFVKGNVDVHDSLHSCRIAGDLCWNGINEILRTQYSQAVIRVRHETCTRSDALLDTDGNVPVELVDRPLPLGPYPVSTQFSTRIFETEADIIVLTVQPDIATSLVRNRETGFLFYPSNAASWSQTDKEWLATNFTQVEPLDVASSMANFERIIARLRQRTEAPILIYNVSAIVPNEAIHCHQGMDDLYSTRSRRFNLGLIELSEKTGVSIIDVDSLIARAGADRLKLDAMHLAPEGYRLIAQEVVRVIDDIGLI